MVLSRLLSALPVGIAIVALLTVASASPASQPAQRPVVKLVARAGPSAPQGIPFAFRATVSNPKRIPVEADISFVLVAPKPDGRSVPFLRKIVVIPPSTTATVDGTVTSAQWFSKRGSFRIEALASLAKGTIAGEPLTFKVVESPVIVPTFQDVTTTAGLSTMVPDGSCGHWTNGAAWADVNGDGALDLFLTRGNQPPQLFSNDSHGHFRDVAAASGIDNGGLIAQGAVFADYNNDGYPDLYVLNDGANRLYKNDGIGHFTDVTQLAGVDDAGSIGTSASWGDYDNDGFLDLYVTNHSRCKGTVVGHFLEYLPDVLYHNNGNGTLSDVTALLEHDLSATVDGSTIGAGFQAAWFDYNGDGRQDLYLANDYLAQAPDANHLWRNDGPGAGGGWQFTDVSAPSGTGYAMNTMGIAVGDYDRDLKLDLALSNISGDKLLHNTGDGTFTDVAGPAGLSRPEQRLDQRSVTWGPMFSDLNNDGWEDLYFAAGYLEAYPGDVGGPQHNELFVNQGKGRFADLSAPSLADDSGQSRGVALADYDRDGRVDIYVVNQGGSPHLYRNVTPMGNRHWLEVDTTGTVSNRDGCGARLTLTAGRVSMLREVFCGSTSVSSGSDSTVHFGLGTATRVTQLVVQWPSGIKQVLRNLKPDRLISVTEP